MRGPVLCHCDQFRYLLLYVYPVGLQSLAMTRAARARVPSSWSPRCQQCCLYKSKILALPWIPGSLGRVWLTCEWLSHSDAK